MRVGNELYIYRCQYIPHHIRTRHEQYELATQTVHSSDVCISETETEKDVKNINRKVLWVDSLTGFQLLSPAAISRFQRLVPLLKPTQSLPGMRLRNIVGLSIVEHTAVWRRLTSRIVNALYFWTFIYVLQTETELTLNAAKKLTGTEMIPKTEISLARTRSCLVTATSCNVTLFLPARLYHHHHHHHPLYASSIQHLRHFTHHRTTHGTGVASAPAPLYSWRPLRLRLRNWRKSI